MFDIKYKSFQIIDRTERGHVSHVTLETVQNIAFFHGVTSPMERARNVIGAKRNLAKTYVSDKELIIHFQGCLQSSSLTKELD